MTVFVIRETFTTITEINASSPEEARAKAEERGMRDFDYVDQSAPIKMTCERVDDVTAR